MNEDKLVVLRLGDLRNSELIAHAEQIVKDLLAVITKGNDLDLDNGLASVSDTLGGFKKNQKLVPKDAITEKLELLDAKRGRIQRRIRTRIESFLDSEREGEHEAAIVLDILWDGYAGMDKKPYPAETVDVKAILTKMATPTLSVHVFKLNLTDLISDLKQVNDEFDALFSQRSITAGIQEVVNTKADRLALIDSLKKFCQYPVTMIGIKENEADKAYHRSVLKIINNCRTTEANMLARRSGRKVAKAAREIEVTTENN